MTTAGIALVLVGLGEALFGFVFFTACTAYSNGSCVDRADSAGGSFLTVAGLIVLVIGAIIFFLGRKQTPG